jgi:hypothetical protein
MPDLVEQPPRSRQATRQTWADRLTRFATSALSVTAFCANEGVSVNSFFYWKRQFAASTPTAPDVPPRLLPVCVQPAMTAVEMVLPNGAVLRLAPGCDLAFVRALLACLTGASC